MIDARLIFVGEKKILSHRQMHRMRVEINDMRPNRIA